MAVVPPLMLPNLPGYNLNTPRDSYRKGQTWGFINGQRMEFREGLSHDKPKFIRTMKPADTWRSGAVLPDSTTRDYFKAAPKDFDELPAWDALDRHVLRFYGYFKESVVETNQENYRVRNCVIMYYLEDDTCHVTEPKQENSGIPQGTLIRRHRFPSAGTGYMSPEDFRVGSDIHVYGKVIRITGCDDFTRQYFDSLGSSQPAAVEGAADPFMSTRSSLTVEKPAQARTYEKIYREVQLGGGHINKDMQQFMECDRKVCRFYAVYDDLATPQYERRPFTILYFLSDDTLEIRELYPQNCGRDSFPIFFRRALIPKGGSKVDGPLDPLRKKSDYVSISDFAVGARMDLVGQSYYIYDADEFTRDYFAKELGSPLGVKKEMQLPAKATPRAPTPPYTGYGSWDDSMSSVLHLIPKVPRKDFQKLYDNDGKVLRFSAKFKAPKAEDASRLFVVSFHLQDDTLSIHEPPQRNLGIVTGKFLEKGVHLNQLTGLMFEPSDLLPGREIRVFNHDFVMLDMDEFTRKFAAEETSNITTDLAAVLEKFRESMRQQFPRVRDIFRCFDKDHNGVITLGEFKKALHKFGFTLSEPEVLVLMRHFDKRRDGQITYNEFCDALLDEDYTTHMLKAKAPIETEFDPTYQDRALEKADQRSETEKIRHAVRQISDAIYRQPGTMQKLFKEFSHMTHKSKVNCEQIHAALMKIGHAFDLADVERCILFVEPDADMNALDYVNFVKTLQACYHDSHATR